MSKVQVSSNLKKTSTRIGKDGVARKIEKPKIGGKLITGSKLRTIK